MIRKSLVPGTTARAVVSFDASDLNEFGKAGAFTLREARMVVGSDSTDMTASPHSWTMPPMVERAFRPSGGVTTSVTSSPVYSAGSGPDLENAWTIAVSSSTSFEVGDYVRAVGQGEGQGLVYKVLAKPTSTSIQIHAKSGGCDIVNGDTIEEVTPTGKYTGVFEFDVDDFLNAGSTGATLVVLASTVSTGSDPHFSSSQTLVWEFDFTLDIGARPYRTS